MSVITVPRTEALARALDAARDEASVADLVFLENWEVAPTAGTGDALRVHQIRRANPDLAAAIRAELAEAVTRARRPS